MLIGTDSTAVAGPALVARGVHKRFGALTVLRSVDPV